MESPTRPLSPSRLVNATLGAPTPRKKVVLEQEDGFDDFFAAAALAEAEQDDEEQPPSSPVKRVQPVASSSAQRLPPKAPTPVLQEETEVISRPGVKEGKRRLVLEPEDGFGDGMDLEGALLALYDTERVTDTRYRSTSTPTYRSPHNCTRS